MIIDPPPIYFYLPQYQWPEVMPERAEQLQPTDGPCIWILQTYLRLRESGFLCELVSKIPDEGIVIGHRESLNYDLKPSSKLLLVCVKGDQNSLPYAQLHIVQNLAEVKAPAIQIQSLAEDRYLLPGKRYYLPHWPQPGLIPRNPARGTQFETVAYYGITYNLAPELRQPSWSQTLEKLGLNWYPETNGTRWHNYTNVDVMVAVRSFDRRDNYPWKPATKLYQAWHAGVPAILGPESAFQAERKSELDYLEVTNVSELIDVLKRLQKDVGLRQAMMENGRERAKETLPDALTQRWRNFLTDICVPAYEQWCQTASSQKQLFFMGRYLALKTSRMQLKLLSTTSKIKSFHQKK